MNVLFGTIKQLPRVLQDEIWEYVRGDRAYWTQQFKLQVNPSITTGFTFQGRWYCVKKSKHFGPFQIRLMRIGTRNRGQCKVVMFKHELELVSQIRGGKHHTSKRTKLYQDSVNELSGNWNYYGPDFSRDPFSFSLGLRRRAHIPRIDWQNQ